MFNNMIENLDRKLACSVMYLDFEMAFNKVPHERLLHRMKADKGTEIWVDGRQSGHEQYIACCGEYFFYFCGLWLTGPC